MTGTSSPPPDSEPVHAAAQDGTAEHWERRLRGARYGVLVLLALTVASAYLTRHCLAVANTTMQSELGFNNEEFGYLYSAFSLGYLICQVPGGWLGQRLGTRVTIPLLTLLWSCMTMVTAVAASLPTLVVSRFGFGLMQAGLIPNQAQVLKDWFPVTQRGMASGAIVTAMSVGSVASLWLTSWLFQFCGWRTLLLGYSVAGIAWSALFFVLFRSRPEDLAGAPTLRPVEPAATDAHPDRERLGAAATGLPLAALLTSVSVWGMFGQMIFKAAGYNLLVTFFPAFLEYGYDVSRERAGEIASWSLVAVVIGSILGGRLIDALLERTGSRWTSRCGMGTVMLTGTAVVMGLACFSRTSTEVGVLIAVSSFLMGLAQPCTWAATIDIGGRNTAVVMGFLNMGSALSGILISPAVGRLMDSIRESGGQWNLILLVHASFYLIAGLAWLAVNPDRTISSETIDAV